MGNAYNHRAEPTRKHAIQPARQTDSRHFHKDAFGHASGYYTYLWSQVLEADALVKRTVYPEVPIRVEYELTELGHSLMPIIRQLTDWALTNMPTILRHRNHAHK